MNSFTKPICPHRKHRSQCTTLLHKAHLSTPQTPQSTYNTPSQSPSVHTSNTAVNVQHSFTKPICPQRKHRSQRTTLLHKAHLSTPQTPQSMYNTPSQSPSVHTANTAVNVQHSFTKPICPHRKHCSQRTTLLHKAHLSTPQTPQSMYNTPSQSPSVHTANTAVNVQHSFTKPICPHRKHRSQCTTLLHKAHLSTPQTPQSTYNTPSQSPSVHTANTAVNVQHSFTKPICPHRKHCSQRTTLLHKAHLSTPQTLQSTYNTPSQSPSVHTTNTAVNVQHSFTKPICPHRKHCSQCTTLLHKAHLSTPQTLQSMYNTPSQSPSVHTANTAVNVQHSFTKPICPHRKHCSQCTTLLHKAHLSTPQTLQSMYNTPSQSPSVHTANTAVNVQHSFTKPICPHRKHRSQCTTLLHKVHLSTPQTPQSMYNTPSQSPSVHTANTAVNVQHSFTKPICPHRKHRSQCTTLLHKAHLSTPQTPQSTYNTPSQSPSVHTANTAVNVQHSFTKPICPHRKHCSQCTTLLHKAHLSTPQTLQSMYNTPSQSPSVHTANTAVNVQHSFRHGSILAQVIFYNFEEDVFVGILPCRSGRLV